MASSRFRSRASIGRMVNRVDDRLQYLTRRPAPRRLQPYSIFNEAMARHAIQNQNVDDKAISGDKIDDGTITNGNMGLDSITADNIQANTITANEIQAETITATEIAAETITGEKIEAGTITGDLIEAGTITADNIQAGTITGDEITANVKLSAPIVYGGGMRAYDVINPDPSTYIGTVPSPAYMTITAATWAASVATNKAQVTCWDNGTIDLFCSAGADKVEINGDIVATRPWVSSNYATSGHGHGTHVHGGVTAGGANTASASVSDERLKKDIEPLDVGLNFIETLNPVKFKFINGDGSYLQDAYGMVMIEDGEEPEVLFRDGVRTHYGLIAQQVRAASDSVTEDDFAGWVHTEDDVQMLRYDEFIAPLIKAVQELSEQNREMRAEIESLKARVQ